MSAAKFIGPAILWYIQEAGYASHQHLDPKRVQEEVKEIKIKEELPLTSCLLSKLHLTFFHKVEELGHLRKHMNRMQRQLLCRKCGLQGETVDHLIFEWVCFDKERTDTFGTLTKGQIIPQTTLLRLLTLRVYGFSVGCQDVHIILYHLGA